MVSFEKCPVCGGELLGRPVEKLLRGGDDAAVIIMSAVVCQSCGERIYGEETIRRFEDIRKMLAVKKTEGFIKIGSSFQVNQ